MKKYCLPDEYVYRFNNTYYDDTNCKDEHQNDVYETALDVLMTNNYNNVIDIGTGSGFKLIKYFSKYNTIGVDLEPTLSFLKNTYPNNTWLNLDELDLTSEYDLIICSDVIEHIPEPTSFIEKLNKFNFKKIVFSTPDKFKVYNCEHFGPPRNPAHVMEWNISEFNDYLKQFYTIEKHFKTSDERDTQIVICSKIIDK